MQIGLITNISSYIHKEDIQKRKEKPNFVGEFLFKQL